MSTKLTDVSSIEKIISEMTLEEKALLITGGSPFATQPMEKYGIPAVTHLDGATGYNFQQHYTDQCYNRVSKEAEEAGTPIDREQFTAMGGMFVGIQQALKDQADAAAQGEVLGSDMMELGCYPPGMFLGSTWNPEAVEACGKSLGDEMGFHHVDVILGPNINIHRDPLAGRAFEGYSEDPYLVGKMGAAMIRGIQSAGVAANAKHFAANNQETNRFGINERISERALREIYFPGFKAAVKEGGVKTIMSAYNAVNGKACAMNPWLLTRILRDEWNYDGYVVSDWAAAYDQVEAVAAGNDLAMPGPRGIKRLMDAVNEGRLEENALDNAIRHFLKVVLDLPVMTGKHPAFTKEEAVQATEAVAQEGIILLKNNGVLPLTGSEKVAFYGRRSKAFDGSGAGSAGVITSWLTNPVDSLASLIGSDHITIDEASPDTKVWIVTVGAGGQEGNDRPDMEMDAADSEALCKAITEARAAGGKLVLLMNTAGPIRLMPYIDELDAVICAFYPGMMGGKVVADILLGKVNPSGKLPLTWPKEYRDVPTYRNFPGESMEVWYGEGIYVGYRYYDTKRVAPLYAFGYGQSYTTFEIVDVHVPETVNVDRENIKVEVTVRNTGMRDGSEVIQVYIHDVVSKIVKPEKELKGFRKVFIKAGETETVTIEIDKETLSSWSVHLNEWAAEPGEYDILVGNSSDNIQVSRRMNVVCANPFAIKTDSAISDVVADPQALAVVNEAIGANIAEVAWVALAYFPSYTLETVFNQMVSPVLADAGLNANMIADIYKRIKDGLAALQ